jgi:aspartyl-tRNA(Asn)/glutamyl-tRNA(Gln) amidotransferase subunit A
MNSAEYAAMTAVEMAILVRQREVSPVELVQAAINSIGSTDAKLNAWCDVFADGALAQAKLLEVQAGQGEFKGVLHGVPIGVKDLFQTQGLRTRRGSVLYADFIPTETAPCVQRIVNAGCVMVGKNTTPETGWKASSTSPLYGVTRNPWDPRCTAGGSSSGSAVAVAAGNVPITLGSDGGGSMRIPAAFCGIFSMKPSLGRVPTYPLSPSEHLSHAGPMTNTVADYALALDAIKGPDVRDPLSLADDGRQYSKLLGEPFSKVRVAVAATLFGKAVDTEIAACVDSAFKTIASMPGVEIVEPVLDWVDPIDVFEQLWIARGALYLGTSSQDKGKMDPGLVRLIEAAGDLALENHLRTLQARARFCRKVWESFEDFDILLTPMLPITAFTAEDDGPTEMDLAPAIPWARWTPFSYPFNITGQPAASVPCGWTSSGMPVGLQVVGQRFDDLSVLRFCAMWEKSFNWTRRRPPVFSALG